MMSSETPEFPENSAPTEALSSRDVDLALRNLRGWNRQEGGLRRRFRRASFADAITFVNEVARLAEELEHHPDIDIRYRNVIVFLTSHDVGGVTQLDLDLATRISELD
jgi:4a-hydroxytetrahydrobiopterin dehydratase